MTSLAVLPSLSRTTTDLMEDDLYQPSLNSTSSNIPATSSSSSSNQATKTLSHLLNIPESFVEHYNRVNGSNPLLTNQNPLSSSSSSTIDPSSAPSDYPNYDHDQSLRTSPFKQYANPDVQSPSNNDASDPSSHYHHMQPPQFYVRPELLLNRNPPATTRRRRITTLDQPELAGVKQPSGDDVLLYNTDIEPSTMMSNTSFFDRDFNDDNSLFIMNSDLDNRASFNSRSTAMPVPGFENDYVMMDDYAESDFSDDSDDDDDDDNYFHDEDDSDDRLAGTTPTGDDFSSQFTEPAQTMQFEQFSPRETAPPAVADMQFGGFMEDVRRNNYDDSMDLCEPLNLNEYDHKPTMEDQQQQQQQQKPKEVSTNMPQLQESLQQEMVSSLPPQEFHHHEAPEDAESTDEVIHHCDQINPANGQPCNKRFTRPYDLIRHQETIHASVKKIFRCVICEGRFNGGTGNGKSKTFSRGDALSRHIKVKHGFGGKEAVDLINDAKLNVEYVPIQV